MKIYRYDAFGNLLPRAVASGSKRKADGASKVLVTGAALVSSGGTHDGALAACYVRAVRPKPPVGLFTSLDNHAGVVSDPVHLQRFAYAGKVPVEAVDPGYR